MKKERIESFRNFEVDPSPGLWNKIEAGLPEKKKRRGFLFWILMGGIISMAGILYFMNDNSVPVISTIENKKQNSTSIEVENGKLHVVENPGTNNIITSEKNIPENKSAINNFKSSDEKNVSGNSTAYASNNVANSDMEEVIKTEPLKYFVEEGISEGEIIGRESISGKKKHLTRWIIYGGGVVTKSSYKSYIDSTNEITQGIEGVTAISFAGGIRYDVSSRIRISFGFYMNTIGQERTGYNFVFLHGAPGDPGNTYSFNSSLGNLSGPGSDFDQAFYNSTDSSLFPDISHAVIVQDTLKVRSFTLREEFKYAQFPLTVTFRAKERLITPYGGFSFSTECLVSHTIKLNDEKLDYEYDEKLSKYIFTAGVLAGLDLTLSRNLDFFVNGVYQKNLNSVIAGENNWKPFVFGVGAGFNYRMMGN